jgi:hypothetical protein
VSAHARAGQPSSATSQSSERERRRRAFEVQVGQQLRQVVTRIAAPRIAPVDEDDSLAAEADVVAADVAVHQPVAGRIDALIDFDERVRDVIEPGARADAEPDERRAVGEHRGFGPEPTFGGIVDGGFDEDRAAVAQPDDPALGGRQTARRTARIDDVGCERGTHRRRNPGWENLGRGRHAVRCCRTSRGCALGSAPARRAG